jgi:hypothetical protein
MPATAGRDDASDEPARDACDREATVDRNSAIVALVVCGT